MEDPTDSFETDNFVFELSEEHIRRRRANKPFKRDFFIAALEKKGKTLSEIHTIIDEIDADADLELASGKDLDQLNARLVTGIVGATLLFVIALVTISGIGRIGILMAFPILGAIGSIYLAIDAQSSINASKIRREYRSQKYQKWN